MSTAPVARVVDMTPELAERILEKNSINRPIRESRVLRYAEDMASGRWHGLNGETIIISSEGRLMNGQHRLSAVVKSGVTIQALLVEGVAESAFDTLDAGLSRKASDALSQMGAKNAFQTASIVRIMLAYRDDKIINFSASASKIREAFERHPEIERYVAEVNPLRYTCQSAGMGVLVMAKLFGGARMQQRVDEFVEGVHTGANLGVFDPRLLLKNKVAFVRSGSEGQMSQAYHWYLTERSFTLYLAQEAGEKTPKNLLRSGVTPFFSEIPSVPRALVRDFW